MDLRQLRHQSAELQQSNKGPSLVSSCRPAKKYLRLLIILQEMLTTTLANFGSRCEITDAFVEKLSKGGVVDKALEMLSTSEEKSLAKTDGGRRRAVRVAKLEDSLDAARGRPGSTLILTEG